MSKKKKITIKQDFEFDLQPIRNEFNLDFNKVQSYEISFSNGYNVTIDSAVQHDDNMATIEAKIFNPDGEQIGVNWPGIHKEEFGCRLYNWYMDLIASSSENTYMLIFERGKSYGGGVF